MATVTVREVMALTPMRGTYVLAGAAGLDRAVSGVNVMEVPDIEAYVKPGELLLTTAYPVRERPERLVELLPLLQSRGLAGLAVKPLRYLEHLPDGLAEAADALAFPVLVVPDRTSFNEVIGAVFAVVVAEYGADPARAEAIRERLTGIALTGGGLDEIARTLAGALDRPVTIVDDDAVVLGRPESLGGTSRPPEGAPDDARRWEFPVTVAGVERGRVLVGGSEEPTLGQRRLVRQACFAAGMHIAQALASIELDRRLGIVFLEELVTAVSLDEAALRQRSRLFGWDLGLPATVVVAACAREPSEATVRETARAAFGAGAVAWQRGAELVALVPSAGGSSTGRSSSGGASCGGAAPGVSRVERWRAALDTAGAGPVVVAAGEAVAELRDLPRSHAAAQEALRVAHLTGRGSVTHDELGLERLVLRLPRDELAAFVDEQVGPLVRHDAESHGDLCRTLDAFLARGNAAEAARQLFVHYNTMKQRLQRIAEVLGVDLHDPRTRLALALALEARRLTGPR